MSNLSAKLFQLLRNPLLYFCLIIFSFGFWKTASDDGLKYVINSDSRGYYAYLPALLIHNDATFQKSHKAEYTYNESRLQQVYLYKSEEGKIYNKYFPGVAVMQLPFFTLATLTSFVIGDAITGYSDVYSFFYLLGSYFYFLVGIYLLIRVARKIYPNVSKINWFIPLIYLSSPLIYFSVFSMASHHYSFALFGLFFWSLLKIQESKQLKHIFLLGLILGLVFLIRPTNISIVLAIPFFLKDKTTALNLISWLFKNKGKPFFTFLLGGLISVFLLMLTWKWESDKWFFWAYNGEGFNWTTPKIFEVLFSFRVGLFVHTPILLLAVYSAFRYLKTQSFQLIFWWIYFAVNTYVISSWWCWDYESPFGMRPFTEHWFVLIMPIFALLSKKQFLVTIALILTSCLGLLRMNQIVFGHYPDQRFTAKSYFKSLAFWKPYNHQRWSTPKSCIPFGELKHTRLLYSIENEEHVDAEYAFTSKIKLNVGRANSRFYCNVSSDKKIAESDWSDVLIVYDATSNDKTKRYYLTREFCFDRLEGKNEWVHFDSGLMILDNLEEYDSLYVYIWNKGGKSFDVKNFKVSLEEYQQK